ncbi:uncharacterized protein K444DRAFT_573140 [Hyaloscypha bicolor E]|uniref:DUF6594 domain-containing protein n=1 Tax=Hyaloscypha bicolor E TaxID=1095630 RepID=A0A2J6SNN1_9HELO|nr:uncharacterized protein K444DRAFT_573140 [Hyaloscypha bicolor E]PMD52381.1 hypothetical protein K444DRAFT_573140 [Hyaloscypha bicolor E]
MSDPVLPLHTLQHRSSPSFSACNTSKASVTATQLNVPQYDLEQRPWKYLGYRVFSRWVASTDAFLIVRQFSTLNARIILALQDDISLLEQQLDTIERKYSEVGPDDYNNGSFRQEIFMDRKILLDKIFIALEKYNSFINEYYKLQHHPPAPKLDIRSVKRWLEVNHPDAISKDEAAYINHSDDLISVRPRSKSPIRRYLESVWWRTGFFPGIFKRQPSDELVVDGLTFWYNDDNIEAFASIVIGIAGLIMFIVPFWALDVISNTLSKLGLITGFVVLFYCMVTLCTTARSFETLAAAAAYAAVLMVFIQVSSNTAK